MLCLLSWKERGTMSNLRIYIATALFHPLVGGVQRQVLEQARNLRKKGYMATIITLRYDKTWPSQEVMEGVPVIRVAGAVLGGREKLPRLFQKLCYVMAMVVVGCALWRHRKDYDILHVYQLNLLALPTTFVCWLADKPMIIGVRCADSVKSTISHDKVSLAIGPLDATAAWLQVNGPNREGADLAALERLGKPVVKGTRLLLQHINAVVIILSSRMKDYLVAHDFSLPNVQLIPNGVDTLSFHPTFVDTFFDVRAQVVVCVCRLCYQKGIDVLLQAWYLIHGQAPQARLIIVGDGPLRSQLENMAKALGITNSIEFTGMQSDVAAQLHRGGLAVLPSRWEGMPNAVLEAMASGLPCVATRVSGSEDIIQHRVNGLLVEPEDYQGMAQALLSLLRDPALAQKYGYHARAAIEKHYSLERITDMYISLYQNMVEGRGWPGQREDLPATSLEC